MRVRCVYCWQQYDDMTDTHRCAPRVGSAPNVKPAPTKQEVIGVLAGSADEFMTWGFNSPKCCSAEMNRGGPCTVNGIDGSRYVYIADVATLRSLELTRFEQLPGAFKRTDYDELIELLPTRVR